MKRFTPAQDRRREIPLKLGQVPAAGSAALRADGAGGGNAAHLNSWIAASAARAPSHVINARVLTGANKEPCQLFGQNTAMKTPAKTPEQMRAHILKTLQKVIANHKAGIPCPTLVQEQKDYRRAIASMIMLPKICPLRRCRRVWRCLSDDAICLTSHRAEAGERASTSCSVGKSQRLNLRSRRR